jgi:hypothetical protein
VGEIATFSRRRNLDTAEATYLLESTLAALDALLLVTIGAHETVSATGAGRPGRIATDAGPVTSGPGPMAPIGEVVA